MTQCFCFIIQGPAGKDGLPGHPGQRGEPVSSFKHQTDHTLKMLGVLRMLMCWNIDSCNSVCNWMVVFTAICLFPVCRVFRERQDPLDLQVWWDLRWAYMSQTTQLFCYIGHINFITLSFSLIVGFRGKLEKLDQWEKGVTQGPQDHLESKVYLVQLAKKGQRSDFHLQTEIITSCCGCSQLK